MQFAHFSHVWNRPGMTPAHRYAQLWRELALADEVGFDYAFAVEHHFSPHESWMPSPAIFCTGAGACTKRLRIGAMGYVVPLYEPMRILEEAAVLDQVLEGRLEIGLVSGILPDYFRHYPRADFSQRRSVTNEIVPLIKTAFGTDGPFSFNGKHCSYEGVKLSVRPQQKPYPPIWLQSRDPDTLAYLAAEGVNTGYLLFLPRDEAAPRYREYLRIWEESGHERRPHIGYWTLVHVDETDAVARERIADHVIHAFGVVFGVGDVGGVDQQVLVETYEKRGEFGAAEIARNMLDVDYLLERGLIFAGSPDTVATALREAAGEGLFDTLHAEFNIGWLEEEVLMRSIRLFGEEVIPRLRDFEPY